MLPKKPLLIREVDNFFGSSSVHGLAYVVSSNHLLVRLFWLSVTVGFFIYSSILVHQAFDEWHKNPTKLTLEVPNTVE